MINNFYVAQFIINYWPPEIPFGSEVQTKDVRRLAERFLDRHTNRMLHDGVKVTDRIAYYRLYHIYIINLALFDKAETGVIDYSAFNQYLLDIGVSRSLSLGLSAPFLRIYFLAHCYPGSPDICFEFRGNSLWVSAATIYRVIESILSGPNGVYNKYRVMRTTFSPLACTVSIVVCSGASGVDPYTNTEEAIRSGFVESFAAVLNSHLQYSPIRCRVLGYIYDVKIDVKSARKLQDINPDPEGETWVSKRSKISFTWDSARRKAICEKASYDKIPHFENKFFEAIYALLVYLQNALSTSIKPRLFQNLIDTILKNLDSIPIGSQETKATFFGIVGYMRAYIRINTSQIEAPTFQSDTVPDTHTKEAFMWILRLFEARAAELNTLQPTSSVTGQSPTRVPSVLPPLVTSPALSPGMPSASPRPASRPASSPVISSPSSRVTIWNPLPQSKWSSQRRRCERCNKIFFFPSLAIHHCRRCGRTICAHCSATAIPTDPRTPKIAVRVCKACIS